MIATLSDFLAVFIIYAAGAAFLIFLGTQAVREEFLPEYLSGLTAVAALIWAAQHVVRM